MAFTITPLEDTPAASSKTASSKTGTVIPYTPSSEFLTQTGMTLNQYDKFRHYIAKREGASYSEPLNKWGYGYRYGFNDKDIETTAKRLEVPVPSREEFRNNPLLQEQFFENYTLHNNKELLNNRNYADSAAEKRAALLAGAHLSNPKTVVSFMEGKSDAADGLGTHVSSYVNGMSRAMGGGVLYGPDWAPSTSAVASEQSRSNTNVVDMNPEEYLSLLPPIPDDESSRTKRDNLRKSLLAGDEIEAIPSLEVKPSRGNLKIVDHDGRNRAQAAIDAGLEEIPVAIRGVPAGEFKSLVGEKTVPYGEIPKRIQEVTTPPAAVVPAQIGVGTPPSPPAITPAPRIAPPANVPPLPPQAGKPDFYPQIVGGINKDIVTPAAAPYRGVAVPNPTDNATAGARIANANATSAGQVGLPPQNVLSSLLSAINPIGSAQAAEQASAQIPPASGSFQLTPLDESGSSGLEVNPAATQQPAPYIPGVSDVAPALINAISPLITGPAAVAAGLRGLPQGGVPGWAQETKNALAQMDLPETPLGKKISNAIASPRKLLGWAAETIAGAHSSSPKLREIAQEELNAIGPYATIAGNALAPLALAAPPGVGNALAAPIRGALAPLRRTPEISGIRAINKAQPAELAAGGTPVDVIRNKLDEAKAAGIPLTPGDFLDTPEAQNQLLSRSLERSPPARAAAREFVTSRTEGIRPTPSSEPVGGTLDRLTRHISDFFGNESAYTVGNKLDKDIKKSKSVIDLLQKSYDDTNEEIKARSVIPGDPQLAALRKKRDNNASELRRYRGQLRDDTLAKEGIDWGQSLYRPSVRIDNISDFLGRANPRAIEHLRTGAGDEMRNRIRRVREGGEPSAVGSVEDLRNKIALALGPEKAGEFLNRVDMEGQVVAQSQSLLRSLSAEPGRELRHEAQFRRALESLGHLGAGAALGHGVYSPLFWALRSGRNIWDYLASGGSITARTRGQAVTNALLDPKAAIAAPGQSGLLQVPPMPSSGFGDLSRALPLAAYASTLPPAGQGE